MAFLGWLPDVLRVAGVDVHVMPGAETRTTRRSGLSPLGLVWHHTATGPNWRDGHVAALLRDGRRDLAGPLSQVGIERDGTWVIVALGRANHNGYGMWGNDSIGLEFYNAGDGRDPWPAAQVESGCRGSAAILNHLGQRITHLRAHKETDSKRKIDPTLDMHVIRKRVAALMSAPTQPTEDDDMVQDIIGFHMAYFGVIPGTDKWTKKVIESVNYHLHRLATGSASLDQIRADFARTVGIG